ncbi:fluoride efflux transporter CrcB [Rhodoligotrophos defluvii]|uniref:fluoride efflux transporter CrcB n=1 Tax=Rhodoligotrophos defluvii TaxID=2561934 RepID=UPI0010C94D9A|nr:fluoride efflux transporter CrcB [Rhodoligotrophos defluvii]
MQFFWPYLVVFLGGGIGSAARHGVNRLALYLVGPDFPAGTMAVNIAGCFIMGLLAGLFAFTTEAPQWLRLCLMTGVLGGFTTFSAFALDTSVLYERGDLSIAAVYVLGSVVLSIAALFAGLAVMRAITP